MLLKKKQMKHLKQNNKEERARWLSFFFFQNNILKKNEVIYMKQKKLTDFLLMTAVASAMLTGCGGSASEPSSAVTAYNASDSSMMKVADVSARGGIPGEMANTTTMEAEQESLKEESMNSEVERKLVRNVSIQLETTNFGETIAEIREKVTALGGYIERISLHGDLSDEYRSEPIMVESESYGNLSIRIPAAKADEFLQAATETGNMTEHTENLSDITLEYYDSKDRIETLETEEARLLELLKEAESVDTMILLEKRLSEIQYELASYQTRLNIYDNQVDYTTIDMRVSEVVIYTAKEKDPFSIRISTGMKQNVEDIKEGAETLLVVTLSHLPTLALCGAAAAAVTLPILTIAKKTLNR